MKIFWDGYGLDNIHSGIGNHAVSLYSVLKNTSLRPNIIGTPNMTQNFENLEPFDLPELSTLRRWILYSKMNWSNETLKKIEHYLQENTASQQPVIFHGLSNINIPIIENTNLNIKKIVTIHDIIPLLVPNSVSKSYLFQFKYLLPKVIKHADAIICVSHWTKESLIAKFPDAEERIFVIHNGFDGKLKPKLSHLREDKKIKILNVGRYEKYKNQHKIAEITKDFPHLFEAHIVTCLKGKSILENEYQTLIKDGMLKLYTNISDLELQNLYTSTDVYVHPSLYEGFCLPALEALCFAKPVVYQSGSGIDEVAGNEIAIPMPQINSIPEWAEAIQQAAQFSSQLGFYDKISMQLKKLPTWEQSAQQLMELYQLIGTPHE